MLVPWKCMRPSGTWSHITHAVQAFSGVYEGFADWEGNRNTSTTGFSTQAQPYLGSYNVLCSVYIPNAIPHVDQCSCDADIANVFSAKLEDLQVHLTLLFVIYWRLSSSDLPATRVWHNHSPSFLLPCCLRKPNTKAGKILLTQLSSHCPGTHFKWGTSDLCLPPPHASSGACSLTGHIKNGIISLISFFVYGCLLDVRNAFDRVNHCILFDKLLQHNLSSVITRALLNWYSDKSVLCVLESSNLCWEWGMSTHSVYH